MTSPHNPTAPTRDHKRELQVPGSTTQPCPSGPYQHHEYYWETVTFLVEDCLFKVPRYYFEKSDIFRTTFSLPPGNNVEGTSDTSPFKLEGINKNDFLSFLRVIYPQFYAEKVQLPLSDWLAALKLSYMWDFDDVRKRAVKTLVTAVINPTDRVILARTHKIRSWLLKGYFELVTRKDPVGVADGKRLGVEAAILVFHVREKISPSLSASDWGSPTPQLYKKAFDIIKATFREELKELEAANPDFAVELNEHEYVKNLYKMLD